MTAKSVENRAPRTGKNVDRMRPVTACHVTGKSVLREPTSSSGFPPSSLVATQFGSQRLQLVPPVIGLIQPLFQDSQPVVGRP